MIKALKFLSIVLAIGSFSLADNVPKTVDISLGGALIPSGFDDNDRTQFVVSGVLPNSCYRVGPHALKIDDEKQTITIQQQSYLYSGVCLQVMTPFTQVVDVGILKQGPYKVLDRASGKELGALGIVASKNAGPDDYLYAPIEQAYISSDSGKNTLYVKGSFADRCSVLDQIKVLYQEHVLVVQPIMRRLVAEGESCAFEKTRFIETVELKPGLHGSVLLHVRSLNGQAINQIVDLP